MMSKDVVIIDGMRTAFGRRGGTLKDFLPTDLAALTIKGLVQKTGILERGTVDSLAEALSGTFVQPAQPGMLHWKLACP